MPGGPTDVGANLALDAMFGRATVTARTVYFALWTATLAAGATPATAGEYAATGYARVAMTPEAPSADTNSRRTRNTNQVTFGPLTGANGSTVITDLAIVSSSSGTTGDMVWRWVLDAPRTPAAGDSVTIAINGTTARVSTASAA